MGTAPEAVVGVPELVFLGPAGLPQRVWAQYQYLPSIVQFGPGIGQALLRTEEAQVLIGLPDPGHKAVQHSRVGIHHKFDLVCRVLRNEDSPAPPLVLPSETAVPAFLLNGIGQHPHHPLEAKGLQHRFAAVGAETHPVETLPDALLNGLLAVDVGAVTGPPESDLTAASGCFQAVCVEIGVICHRPASGSRRIRRPSGSAPERTRSFSTSSSNGSRRSG